MGSEVVLDNKASHADIQAARAEGIILDKRDGAFVEKYKRPKRLDRPKNKGGRPWSVKHAEYWNVVRRRYLNGDKLKDICAEVKVSQPTLNRMIEKLGLPPRRHAKKQRNYCISVSLTKADMDKVRHKLVLGGYHNAPAYIRALIARDY